MILYKMFLILLVIVLAETMVRTIRTGRLFKQFQRSDSALNRHKKYARALLFFTTIAVVVIEIGVIVTGREWDFFTAVHLLFALPFGTLVVLLNKTLNGEKFSRHGQVVYFIFIPAFIGAVVTGIPLILNF